MRIFGFLVCLFLSCSLLEGHQLEVPISAEGAILINADTGAILLEKNAQSSAFPASITKVATALYILREKRSSLGEVATVRQEAIASITPQAKKQSNYRSPPYWLETDGGHISLKRGEEIPVRDLLYAMLISSANDASNVLAEHFGGSVPKFMEELNAFLCQLGCRQTYFLNPHGLHHPDHVTTPYDMALIAQEAMKDPLFREMVSTVRYTCPQTNLELERTFIQTNLLLRNGAHFYPKATGIKTGTTQAAGKTLIASSEEGGRRLIAVVLGVRGNERYTDVVKLFEAAYNEPKMQRLLLSQGEWALTTKVRGGRGRLKTGISKDLYHEYYPAEETSVKAAVRWTLPPLPIACGAEVGVVRVIDERGNRLQEVPLFAAEEMQATLWTRFKQGIKERRKWILGGVLVGLILIFFIARRKRRRSTSRPLF